MDKERDINNEPKTSATVLKRGDNLHGTVSKQSAIRQY